jgi:hypothetical protein
MIREDRRGIAAEATECIQMAMNQGVDIYLQFEFGVSNPGIAEDYGKTVEL